MSKKMTHTFTLSDEQFEELMEIKKADENVNVIVESDDNIESVKSE